MSREHLDRMTAAVDAALVEEVRREWKWLVPRHLSAWRLTWFGDWLFLGPEDRVFFVDVMEGRISFISPSLDALEESLAAPERRDELFLEGLLLPWQPVVLPRNTVFGFKVPQVFAGRTELANVEMVPVKIYQMWLGQLHRKLSLLPANALVEGVDVDAQGKVSLRWKPGPPNGPTSSGT